MGDKDKRLFEYQHKDDGSFTYRCLACDQDANIDHCSSEKHGCNVADLLARMAEGPPGLSRAFASANYAGSAYSVAGSASFPSGMPAGWALGGFPVCVPVPGVWLLTDSGMWCRFPMQDVTPTTLSVSLAWSVGEQLEHFNALFRDPKPSSYHYCGHIAMENAKSVIYPELIKREFDKDERWFEAMRSLVQTETGDALDPTSVVLAQRHVLHVQSRMSRLLLRLQDQGYLGI